MNFEQKYHVIGIMSGTSLDGIDIVKCVFTKRNQWEFYIEEACTSEYNIKWKSKLKNLHLKNKSEIQKVHISYGELIAKEILKFIKKYSLYVDIICSHGHTILHAPHKKITLQIGCGQTIARITKKKTITDFRSLDIQLGGQGAPLVPIGDLLLFKNYKYCVNLGGFANISIKTKDTIKAYDICPANFMLNFLSNKLGKDFDLNGNLAKTGKLNADLLQKLNNISFYKESPPKSLSREWVEQNILPLLKNTIPLKDCLHTFCEHIGFQVGSKLKNKEALLTGGGTFNNFLIQKIRSHSKSKLIIPEAIMINFKEAIIFGLLGVLKLRNEVNSLHIVTGASQDSSGGEIYTH